jgi:exodeoxyribonuclease VII small subunit
MKPRNVKLPTTFEAALQEFEQIVLTLESGGTPLEESLQAYERGMALRHFCEETLTQAEQKIRLLENGSLRELTPTSQEVITPTDDLN